MLWVNAFRIGRAAGLILGVVLISVRCASAADAIVTDKAGVKIKLRSVTFQQTHYTPSQEYVFVNGSPGSSSTHPNEVVQIGTGSIVVELQVTDIKQITLAEKQGRDSDDQYLSGTVLLADGVTSIPIRIPVFVSTPENILNRFNWKLAGESDHGPFSIDLLDLREITFTSQDQTGSSRASVLPTQQASFQTELRFADGSKIPLSLPDQSFKLVMEDGAENAVRLNLLEEIRFATTRRQEAEAGFVNGAEIEVISRSGQTYKGRTYDYGLNGMGKFGPYIFKVIVPFSSNAKELSFGN
jgi:hypothetical protein